MARRRRSLFCGPRARSLRAAPVCRRARVAVTVFRLYVCVRLPVVVYTATPRRGTRGGDPGPVSYDGHPDHRILCPQSSLIYRVVVVFCFFKNIFFPLSRPGPIFTHYRGTRVSDTPTPSAAAQ